MADLGAISDNIPKEYKVILKHSKGGESNTVNANLPPEFSFGLDIQWTMPFASGIGDLAQTMLSNARIPGANQAQNLVSAATGHTLILKAHTAQVYGGCTPLTVTIPFVFQAINDTQKEVVDPIKYLLRLAAPYLEGKVLVAPLHVLGLKDEYVSLSIGQFIYLPFVVLKSVHPTFKTILYKNGKPMSATVEVTVETFYAITKNDVDEMFV